MKTLKRVIAWVFISLIFQAAFYFYLNNYYFSEETSIKITQLDSSNKNNSVRPVIGIPSEAKEIGLSYDGKFTSYIDVSGNLKVIELSSGKDRNVNMETDAKYLASKWLPDSNIIMLAELLTEKGSKAVRFFSYDAEKDDKKEVGDFNKETNFIPVKTSDIKVKIEVSTLTGVMYAGITGNNTSTMYRVDRNEHISTAALQSRKIGTFKVASHDDLLAYEDLEKHEIRTTSKNKIIDINGKKDLLLLAADENDNIYVGNNIGGKVSKIYYGKLSDKPSAWKEAALGEPILSQNIIITPNGYIYLNYKQGNLIKLKNNCNVTYNGKLIGVCDDFIASLSENKLNLSNME